MTVTPELRWHAVGRRKESVARVYLTPGSGKWNINGRTLGDFFPRASLVSRAGAPDARPAGGRAEEAGSRGRAEAVPVLEEIGAVQHTRRSIPRWVLPVRWRGK